MKNIRFKNLELRELMIDDESINYEIESTEELIEATNKIRKEFGNTDLVKVGVENMVYYNFYLVCNMKSNKVSIEATCNHGELDDFRNYKLGLFEEEKVNLLYQVIAKLTEEIMEL